MELSTILALGNFGMGLFGAFSSKNASNRQASIYEEQSALNRQIGAFNAEIAEKTGVEAVRAIAQQTKRVIGQQMVAFANRGITMEGSPMLVLGETLTMGSKHAQETYFNAEVKKINYLYAAQGASANAASAAESATAKATSSTIDIFKQFTEGAKLLQSSLSSGVTNSGDKSSIFNNATWMI
jgi:hypothetical protein